MTIVDAEDHMIEAEQALESLLAKDPELRPVFEAQRHAMDLLDKIVFRRYLDEIEK